jgi:predicted amidohydrolase
MAFMPKKLGVFHFGSDDRKMPDRLLEGSIEEAGGKAYVCQSVIILPEAFNIGVKYEKNDDPDVKPDFNPDIIDRLKALAARFECAFVAGLVVDPPEFFRMRSVTSLDLPSSAAYLVSATCSKVLSLKAGEDQMAGVVYRKSTAVDSPVAFDQATVSALICMDADTDGKSHKRHKVLRQKVKELGGSCPILCVPANTSYLSTGGLATGWVDFHFALANGCCLPNAKPNCAGYYPSVIKIMGKEPESFQDKTNKVIVLPLEDLNPIVSAGYLAVA